MDAGQADGRSDAVTVAVQLGECGIRVVEQVHLYAIQDGADIRTGDAMAADRVVEGGVQRMAVVACQRPCKIGPPSRELLLLFS